MASTVLIFLELKLKRAPAVTAADEAAEQMLFSVILRYGIIFFPASFPFLPHGFKGLFTTVNRMAG